MKLQEEFGDLLYSVCSLIGRKTDFSEQRIPVNPNINQVQIDLGILSKQLLSDSSYGKIEGNALSERALELSGQLLLNISALAYLHKIDPERKVRRCLAQLRSH